jgi:hypothetical protein
MKEIHSGGPIPEQMSRFLEGRGKVDPEDLPRGPHGRALCRWCQTEVPPRRRSFCGPRCVHEWKLRSQGDYLRQQVFRRDRGRCCGCGLDTQALERRLKPLGKAAREQALRRLGLSNAAALWEAHHVKGVYEGGGACGLDNMRTLCTRCHRQASARQSKARRPGDLRSADSAPGPSET